MAQTSNPPTVEPRPAPTPTPAPTSETAPTPASEAELKAATDKEIAERLSSPPETPTPTQEEADAIKTGEYDASAPEGARVKKRAVEPAPAASGYTTR